MPKKKFWEEDTDDSTEEVATEEATDEPIFEEPTPSVEEPVVEETPSDSQDGTVVIDGVGS